MKPWHFIAGFVILGLTVGLILPALNTAPFTPHIDQVETLEDPIAVSGWSNDRLTLDDGRRIGLPGITGLPSESEALTGAIAKGVEITPDGRVIGLLKIHHWCGNDPVRTHIARVDLAHLLMFVGEVEFETDEQILKDTRDGEFSFSEYGWDVGDYYQFLRWSEVASESGI